jgi:RNA polymerase sigma factor (sigma-70 family)
VFRELYPKLLRYASVVADPGTEADDLVQEALATTMARQRLSDLDHPQAYLRRAILNCAIDRQRHAVTLRRYAADRQDAAPHTPSYPSDLADLDHLDPRDRAILYLVHIEGLPYSEVAELTGESAENARLRASRARRQLRRTLLEEASDSAPTTLATNDDQENDR